MVLTQWALDPHYWPRGGKRAVLHTPSETRIMNGRPVTVELLGISDGNARVDIMVFTTDYSSGLTEIRLVRPDYSPTLKS